jgi:hypothetical protein
MRLAIGPDARDALIDLVMDRNLKRVLVITSRSSAAD